MSAKLSKLSAHKGFSISIAMIAACVLIFSAVLFSGCSNKPKVTLNVKAPEVPMSDPDNNSTIKPAEFLDQAAKKFKAQYQDADVVFNIQEFDAQDEDDAITDTFDTDEATDVLFESYSNMAEYVHSGRVVPLDSIISDEMRSDIDPALWELSSINGKTYMMPYFSLQNMLVYNKKLFKEAGLEKYIADEDIIQNWTPEEWNEILATLKEKLSEDAFPMMMYAKDLQGDTHIMTLLRSQGSTFFDGEGNIHLNTPEGIAALAWIKDCYDKGYFPPNSETLSMNENANLFHNNQLGIYVYNAANQGVMADLELGYVNLPSKNGKGYVTSFVTGFEVFDNGNAEKLKAAENFVSFIFNDPDLMAISAGEIPASKAVAEEREDKGFMLEEQMNNTCNSVNYTQNDPNWEGVREVFNATLQKLMQGTITPEQAAAEIDEAGNAAITQGRALSQLHE